MQSWNLRVSEKSMSLCTFLFFQNMLNKERADGVWQRGQTRRCRGRRYRPLKCFFASAARKQKSFVVSECLNLDGQDRETDALVRYVLLKPLS